MILCEAERLARALIAQHVDPLATPTGSAEMGPVRFRWSRSVRVLGTYHVRKAPTAVPGVLAWERTISLSRRMAEVCDETTVREIILHEIAHARAGVKAGHGPLWARECNLLQIEPKVCGGSIGMTLPIPRGGWVAQCPHCQARHWKARRPSHNVRTACGHCRTAVSFDSRVLTWTRG